MVNGALALCLAFAPKVNRAPDLVGLLWIRWFTAGKSKLLAGLSESVMQKMNGTVAGVAALSDITLLIR